MAFPKAGAQRTINQVLGNGQNINAEYPPNQVDMLNF